MEQTEANIPVYKRAKILATLGPVTNSYEMIEKLIEAGTNGFRLNFSHGTNDERIQQITWIRQASEALSKPVAILQDLQGPKIRLGNVDGELEVKKGEHWNLTYGQPTDEAAKRLEVQYDLSAKMRPGEPLYLFDGKVKAKAVEVKPEEKNVTLEVLNDGVLMARKGLNLPETDFAGDVLTEKDLKDIEFGAAQDIDYVAMSFVQQAEDIKKVKQLLEDNGSTARVIAKIETKSAIKKENLEEIIKASDGAMVARGDLAVEAGAEVVPIVQRDILELCQKHGKLSIVATQMMASMVDMPTPTRAEVSDVSHAVEDGADCLMTSDETANGNYPLETIRAMKRVILYTQVHAPFRPIYFRAEMPEKQDAISSAATTLAGQLEATAIVAETRSGATARSIANHRPSMPIISVTSDKRVSQQLALLYATKSFLRPDGERAGLSLAKELRSDGFLPPHSTIILVSGRQPGVVGTTDTIRVRMLE